MLQKAKYLIIGLLVGMFITGCAAAAFGGPAIKVYLDGAELPNAALNVDGQIYVPLRAVSEALGLNVTWDAAQGAVKLNRQATAQSATQSPPVPDTKEEDKVSNIQTYQDEHGFTFIIENGIEYYPVRYILDTNLYSKGYNIGFKKDANDAFLAYNDKPGHPVTEYKTILQGIPFKIFSGQSYIPKDYYLNKILPLVK